MTRSASESRVSSWLSDWRTSFGARLGGLRGNAYQGNCLTGLLTRYFAPIGLLFMLAGAFHLLTGRVPDAPPITLAVFSFVVVGVWGIRIRRTFKAHLRELIKEREHLKS